MIQKIGTLGNAGGPLLVDRILSNNVVMATADSVRTVAGFLALGVTGARVLGHVEGFVGRDGLSPVKDGSYLGNVGNPFTATANNTTVAQVRARVDVDTRSIYSAELDAAVGTTTAAGGSGAAGKNFDLVDKDTLDESTSVETTAQYYSHGIDLDTPTNVVVNILESEVFGF